MSMYREPTIKLEFGQELFRLSRTYPLRVITGGNLSTVNAVKWMTRKPAPDDLLVLVNCHCQTGCGAARCSCVREGMQCTDACGCQDCDNQPTPRTRETDSKGSDDDTDF